MCPARHDLSQSVPLLLGVSAVRAVLALSTKVLLDRSTDRAASGKVLANGTLLVEGSADRLGCAANGSLGC